MTNQLKWRLGKLPTPDEVLGLVNDKLITKEEARQILFTEENATDRDEQSLKEEIKFLREMVEKLANNNSRTIIEYIERIKPVYVQYPWYQPYVTYCSAGNTMYVDNGTNTISANGTGTTNCAFTSIETF